MSGDRAGLRDLGLFVGSGIIRAPTSDSVCCPSDAWIHQTNDSVRARVFYQLSHSSWGSEEVEAMQRVIAGGHFTMGPRVAEFEKVFAEYFGSKYAVMVNSGSSANLVAVASCFFRAKAPLKRGDEVIVPAVSWATTYSPLQQYGLRLRFVDIGLDTLNMDVALLEGALTPRTRMIVGVSILGNPAALDVIRTFADTHGLVFLEDNAESIDAELNGRKTGTFGDMGTFSFFFSHHISTMEGGMILTDDGELRDLANSLRSHGWTRGLPADTSLFERSDGDRFESYRFILPGYNVRPSELAGAVGLEQIKKLPAMTETRRKNLTRFQELFGADERFIIQKENGKSSSFSFPIILNPDMDPNRNRIFNAMHDADIEFRIITGGCFPRHDAISYFDFELVGDLVNANIAHDYGFFVGNYPSDVRSKLDTLYQVLDRAWG